MVSLKITQSVQPEIFFLQFFKKLSAIKLKEIFIFYKIMQHLKAIFVFTKLKKLDAKKFFSKKEDHILLAHSCICATIRIRRDIQCLLYEGFILTSGQKSSSLKPYTKF